MWWLYVLDHVTAGCVLAPAIVEYILPAHPGQKRFGLRWGVSSKCIFNENQAAYCLLVLLSKRVLCFSLEESVFWRQFRNKRTTNVICGKRNQKGRPGFGLCPCNIITHYAVFSVPDETEVDLRRIRSLCTLSLFAGYRKVKPAQITLLLEHWELLF